MFRKVEAPIYTNVYSDSKGVFGVVEYNTHRELRSVMRDMRGIDFKNPFCEPTPVDLIDDTDDADRDPVGSESPPRHERSRSRDRDVSPRRDRDRRSRSRCALPLSFRRAQAFRRLHCQIAGQGAQCCMLIMICKLVDNYDKPGVVREARLDKRLLQHECFPSEPPYLT
jgi:hypothetical protein